jgi:deoxycytidylate deaminase
MSKKEYQKRWYEKHKSVHIKNVSVLKRAQRDVNRQKSLEFLKEHPCVDCGESDVVVLQFDHIRGTKKYEISKMISTGYPWKRIAEEIEKCDVRCANDHVRRTAQVQNSFRFVAQRQSTTLLK